MYSALIRERITKRKSGYKIFFEINNSYVQIIIYLCITIWSIMDYKKLITILGFTPKEHTVGIFTKKYSQFDGYYIDINLDNQLIDYNGIVSDSKTTQNFSQPENFVVLECVDRLLTKGYKPQNIILEKTWSAGHGTSGRLDICVTRDDGTEYLLIECKTYGKEYEKELARMNKDGGQLFTYFKFSNKADIIMLYASEVQGKEVVCQSEAVKIEDDYRTGDVKDFYKTWNKKTHQNIVWENLPYNSDARKSFTKKDLRELDEQGSKKIFNEFASILRKHSVSDKPNAFNKIFNLFLAKLFDEAKKESDELEFHWREDDNAVDFQVRLINLHKDGLYAFLQKEIEGIQDADFGAITSQEELQEKKKKILKFNNVFAIKDVLDDASFDENQRVLKDVVQLLEKYQIRYPRKQQHLSDFFELLLTTGLKQEVGQYFTPPPITKFIVRSLPIKQMVEKEVNKEAPELPAIIDYAAGSGHFITEAMEEYQDIINGFTKEKIGDFYPKAKKQIAAWQADPYEWAAKYVYGVEKDYRLVKVAKVGCYFYGDGVAQIIHGDGLDNFATSKTYKGLLKENTNLEDSAKAKFSLVLSNPPYSVNDCKDDLEYIGAQSLFTLYPYLSDKSKDIECLFVERTKQLLKDDGIAAIILPSSILNNAGIQTKTREIILQYFDIVAITELGGNTFMATSTKTVTLFLRRRSNQNSIKVKNYVTKFLIDYIDNSINGIEKPVTKYVNHVWDGVSFESYITLLQKTPDKVIENSELYREYRKKIKAKTDKEFWSIVLGRESDKLYYFILAYLQQVVIVKSGEKDAEKQFLGYYFKERRGSEGIHATQVGKTIDECTKLFDPKTLDNPEKASTYIHRAFAGDTKSPIIESLGENVSRASLIDMITFDRADFEKSISLSVKKKVKIESKYSLELLSNVANIIRGVTYSKSDQTSNRTKNVILTADNITLSGELVVSKEIFLDSNLDLGNDKLLKRNDCFMCFSSGSKQHIGKVAFIDADSNFYAGGFMGIIRVFNDEINPRYLFEILNSPVFRDIVRAESSGSNINNLSNAIDNIKVPLPPINVQAQIVVEIEAIEKLQKSAKDEVERNIELIMNLFNEAESKADRVLRLSDDSIFDISIGQRVLKNEFVEDGKIPVYSANVVEPFGSIDKLLITDFNKPSVLWGIDGDWMVNFIPKDYPFYPTDHCGVLRVKDNSVDEKYLAFILEKEGKLSEFSRTKRASINRVQGMKISVPPIGEQQKIVAQIEALEAEIAKARQIIDNAPAQKAAILKKYL